MVMGNLRGKKGEGTAGAAWCFQAQSVSGGPPGAKDKSVVSEEHQWTGGSRGLNNRKKSCPRKGIIR